jgi:hypothetical protein
VTVIAARPSVVIGPKSERPLDGADAPLLRESPGQPTGAQKGSHHVHTGAAVWAPYNGHWRQGWTLGAEEPGASSSTYANGKRATAVQVEYVADRRGTVLVHRFPVSELRLRDVAP